jgi:hypothetical protein
LLAYRCRILRTDGWLTVEAVVKQFSAIDALLRSVNSKCSVRRIRLSPDPTQDGREYAPLQSLPVLEKNLNEHTIVSGSLGRPAVASDSRSHARWRTSMVTERVGTVRSGQRSVLYVMSAPRTLSSLEGRSFLPISIATFQSRKAVHAVAVGANVSKALRTLALRVEDLRTYRSP